jgi:hypothetical protein
METTTEKSVEVLNDLIEINNDRIDGFDRATQKNLVKAMPI